MKVFQSSRRSIVGALLLFLLHGSCADDEVVHKAVGDSLDLPANQPKDNLNVEWKFNGDTFAEYEENQFKPVEQSLFPERIQQNNDNISVTIENLKHQDSGNFTIVAKKVGGRQHPTKLIVLHVHDRVKNVQIDYKISRLSKNCTFHLHCETLDDLNSSYSWSSDQGKSLGPQLNISLHPAESRKVSCTANNTVSQKSTEKTLVCTEESKYTGFRQELWLTISISILAIVILSGIIIACFRWRKRKGQTESEAGITVYEDVNPEGPAKKRTESVVNGMSIYETVDDIKVDKNLPQTIYDKLNYQRHPTVTASTSSPYQEVL
ncbi:uncharacterized protein si:cabz01074944.1 isoform X2 [Danio rerio]|uniref:Uncharacterized protein si:cabz01074944.1 isoform X2 n=1 Tax=Danio rerio TaxID=7955 RepID=A0A8M2BJI5_DANRE|nr:T-lymphocyte surface antigen Ly-9-like [Danio rerio]|eukprot:XP_005172207.1 T-lymphocyte surface antigen Ly-9-like [Danio rerio]